MATIQQPLKVLAFPSSQPHGASQPCDLPADAQGPAVTPDSVERAKATQRIERAAVEAQTGWVFIGDRLVNPWLVDEVPLRVALTIGNAIWLAVYGSATHDSSKVGAHDK